MDNVGYKSCIVPMCENNSDITPNLTFFEVPTKTHNYIIDKWREAIGISMDLNTVIYCCQDHFDLHEDTYNYIEYYMSGDANGENKIQLQLKYDAVPHRFDCQYRTGHRVKPVSTECNKIEGSSIDMEPLPYLIKLEEINDNDIDILNNSPKKLDLEETLEPVRDTSDAKEPIILTTNSNNEIKKMSKHIMNNRTRFFAIRRTKRLMALCKPLKIQLEDLKHVLEPRFRSLVTTDVLNNGGIKKCGPLYSMAVKRKPNETSEIGLKKKRKMLISQIMKWEREQNHCIAIHDIQNKEIDIYYLNSNLDITTYTRITDVSRISDDEQYSYKAEFKGRSDRLRIKQCCCWFNRENHIEMSLAVYFQRSYKFTKKTHPCKGNICTCCCKKNLILNSYRKLPDIDETVSVWLENIIANYKLSRPSKMFKSAVVKAIGGAPNIQINNIVEIDHDSVSLNLIINNDFYRINNGHLVLYTKNEEYSEFSNISSIVNKNICCWYSREIILKDLLKRKVSLSAIRFIRTPHLCPLMDCKCCCKPIQHEKTYLPFINAIMRHTTDTRRNMKIKIVFSSGANSSEVTPSTKTMISQNNTSKAGLRILDTKILHNPTSTTHASVTNTRTWQSATSVSPVSNPKILQNNTSLTHVPISDPLLFQNEISKTAKFNLSTLISQSIQHNITTNQDISKFNSCDSQQYTFNNSIPDSLLQPFAHHTVPEPTTFLDPMMTTKDIPPNLGNEMSATPNNNMIITSVVSLAGVQASSEAVAPNVNTMTDVVPEKTINSFSSIIKRKSKPIKDRQQKCRAKNPSKCRCKFKSSVSDTNLSPISINSENIDRNKATHIVNPPKVGSIVSMDELNDVLIPVSSDEIQDSNEPSTFVHIPKTGPTSVAITNLTAKIRTTPTPMPTSIFNHLSESGPSTSHAPVKNNEFTPNRFADTLRSSTINILHKLKDLRFIHKPGRKLLVDLGTDLKNLSTTELKILNSTFMMVENQIKAAGLVKEVVSFNLNNIFDNVALTENPTSNESIVPNYKTNAIKPADIYTHFGAITSLKQKDYTESLSLCENTTG